MKGVEWVVKKDRDILAELALIFRKMAYIYQFYLKRLIFHTSEE
jgi:hypothetical protein